MCLEISKNFSYNLLVILNDQDISENDIYTNNKCLLQLYHYYFESENSSFDLVYDVMHVSHTFVTFTCKFFC